MKRTLTLLLLVIASAMTAGEVGLSWDASPSTNVVSYRIYAAPGTNAFSTIPLAAAPIAVNVTNRLTCVVSNLPSGTWSFVATAVADDGQESDKSNEIWCKLKPGSPRNSRFLYVRP